MPWAGISSGNTNFYPGALCYVLGSRCSWDLRSERPEIMTVLMIKS